MPTPIPSFSKFVLLSAFTVEGEVKLENRRRNTDSAAILRRLDLLFRLNQAFRMMRNPNCSRWRKEDGTQDDRKFL